jgi:glucose/arabinose dehydrogenase
MKRMPTATVAVLGAALMTLSAASRAAGAPSAFAPRSARSVQSVHATKIVGGLDFPTGFTFAADGRIFYGERFTGEIRIYDPVSHSNTHFDTIANLKTEGERGLLGIALHPDYPATAWVYVYATVNVSGHTRNQIIRIDDVGGTGGAQKILWQGADQNATNHVGGRILFGPDGMLYFVQGDLASPGNAQNLDKTAGKVLRMTPGGKVPDGNPFPDSKVWSYGLRNSFGFNFDPVTGYLWETENGPECNDEVNRIRKGKNFGWGSHETCSTPPSPPKNTNQDGPSPILPDRWWDTTIAPVGLTFCVGCSIADQEGTMWYAAYNTSDIRRAKLDASRKTIDKQGVMYHHSGSVYSMERGPDEEVYFSDSGAIWKLTT